MPIRIVILAALALGPLAGCSKSAGPLEGLPEQSDPNYGASLAEKLKNDVAAENARVNFTAPANRAGARRTR